MLKRILLISALVILLALAGGLYFLPERLPVLPPNETIARVSSVLKPPVDEKALVKELKRLTKEMDKSKPHGPYIVIDTHANWAFYRTADSVMFRAQCSTGSGGELTDPKSGKKWVFNTPHGVFAVKNKIVEPWWRKPDWAFIEEGEEVPKNAGDRLDPNVMGDYALGFGDGYFIHGTLYERLLGLSVSHGCVRLGSDNLKYLYDRVPIGTGVYVL